MIKVKLVIIVLTALFSSAVWAADLSSDALIGKWIFVNWADSDTPKETRAVNLVMDFQADGQVVTETSNGEVAETYKIEGDSIIYHGKRGDQNWKLISFIPDESMVVENAGTIMTFKRK